VIRFLALLVAGCITLIWWPDKSINDVGPVSWVKYAASSWVVLTCHLSIWASCILLVIARPAARPRHIGWVLLALAGVELAIPTALTLSGLHQAAQFVAKMNGLEHLPVAVRFLAWTPPLLGAALHGFVLAACVLILVRPDCEYPARRLGAVGVVMIVGAYASAQALQLEYPIELGHWEWPILFSPTFIWYREVAKVSLGCLALCLMLDRVTRHRRVLAGLWIAGWVFGVLIPTAYSLHLPFNPFTPEPIPLYILGQHLWWLLAWLILLTNIHTAKVSTPG